MAGNSRLRSTPLALVRTWLGRPSGVGGPMKTSVTLFSRWAAAKAAGRLAVATEPSISSPWIPPSHTTFFGPCPNRFIRMGRACTDLPTTFHPTGGGGAVYVTGGVAGCGPADGDDSDARPGSAGAGAAPTAA